MARTPSASVSMLCLSQVIYLWNLWKKWEQQEGTSLRNSWSRSRSRQHAGFRMAWPLFHCWSIATPGPAAWTSAMSGASVCRAFACLLEWPPWFCHNGSWCQQRGFLGAAGLGGPHRPHGPLIWFYLLCGKRHSSTSTVTCLPFYFLLLHLSGSRSSASRSPQHLNTR